MNSDYTGATFAELVGAVARLEGENMRLRQKNRNQKLELRRLNAAHVVKNARIHNQDTAASAAAEETQKLRRELEDSLSVVRSFLAGEIEVVRPFKQVPMPAHGAPDLMSMVKDLTPLLPGNKPE